MSPSTVVRLDSPEMSVDTGSRFNVSGSTRSRLLKPSRFGRPSRTKSFSVPTSVSALRSVRSVRRSAY